MNRTTCMLKSILSHAQRSQKLIDCTHRTYATTSPPYALYDHSSSQSENEKTHTPSTTPDIESCAGNESIPASAKDAPRRSPPPDPWSSISAGESHLIVGGQPFSFKCGHVARFADGAAVCQIGHTAVLVTAVGAKPEPGTGKALHKIYPKHKRAAFVSCSSKGSCRSWGKKS